MSDISEPPETIRVKDEPLPPAVRQRLAALLAEGAIVCLPTESVYGLAVRADRPEPLRALRALKGAPGRSTFTWHAPDASAFQAFEVLRPLIDRLVARYVPGPLTLVLDGVPQGLELASADGATGVRVPAHAATRDLLAALSFPVVMTSANPAGAPPAPSAEALDPRLAPRVAAIVDAGPARLGEASAVLRLGKGRFEVLREGLVGPSELQRVAGLRLGFCCTGNTCRSPMAAGLAEAALRRRLGCDAPDARSPRPSDFGFSVESMGVAASNGSPASPHAVEVLGRWGIDLRGHRSRHAVPERVVELDRVYGLTSAHLDALAMGLPPGAPVRLELLDPAGRDIPDPIGAGEAAYRRCAEAIREAVEQRAREWA